MRVLLVSFPGARSHLYTMAPLAWALRLAGHQVVFAGTPDLAASAAGTGVPFSPVGSDVLAGVLRESGEAEEGRPGTLPAFDSQAEYADDHPQTTLDHLVENLMAPLSDTMTADLVDLVRAWSPDLVIWDQLCLAGPLAAAAVGVPHARFLYGSDSVEQLRDEVARRGESDAVERWLADRARLHGLDLGTTVAAAASGTASIDLQPDWTWHPATRRGVHLPLRHLAFNGPVTVPRWVHEPTERPRLCLTLGVSHRELGVEGVPLGELLDAVADLPADVVATFTRAELGTLTLPENVTVHDFVPLGSLLPTCTAVVHHGGAGAFANALEHGVPQVIVPTEATRWLGPLAIGEALEREGAGVLVAEHSAAALRAGIERVLDSPSHRHHAARLRARYHATPSPSEVVTQLEALAGIRPNLFSIAV